MRVVVGLPSGNRLPSLISVCQAWRDGGVEHAVMTWDKATHQSIITVKTIILTEDRLSWGANHNRLARELKDWDVYICGNDDTYPHCGIEFIEKVAEKYDDYVIYPNTGFIAMCFPIVTRKWYDAHGCIFDEQYIHNFVDNDLLMTAAREKKAVNCTQIVFDHRHYVDEKYVPVVKNSQSTYFLDQEKAVKKWGTTELLPSIEEQVFINGN